MAGAPTRNARAISDEVITNPVAAPSIGDGSEVQSQMSRIDRMRKYFANQPREEIRIRKEEGDQVVQINGFTFWIKHSERVKVPVDVAEILRQANII